MREFSFLLLSLAATLVLGGCVSRPASPAPVSDENTAAAGPASATIPGPAVPVEALMDKVLANATQPAPLEGEGWKTLLSGFEGWKEARFAGGGEIEFTNGTVLLNMGDPFTGMRFTNAFPTVDYEIAFDAMRVMGGDFFCGLTFPIGESHCTLVVGGWGGSLVGLSSIDSMDASENQTTRFMSFHKGKWYRIRLRVTRGRIEAWIDQEKVVNLATQGRHLTLRPGEIEICKPLGIACWQTAAAFRDMKWRAMAGSE
jgi:hypothetical protein